MGSGRLAGRVALVTGSTTGIGLATAARLAAEGCDAVLTGLDPPEEGEALAVRLARETGRTVRHRRADLSLRAETEGLVAAVIDDFGRLDILVNNAVVRHYRALSDFEPSEWDRAMAVNVTAPFDLCRLALPAMRAGGWGRIVNVSSVLGLAGRSGRADYVTSKAAIAGLTRAVAAETLRDPAITCNAIHPGSVLTPFIWARIERLAEAEGLPFEAAAVRYRHDLGQHADFIAPERVAATIAFLCSDEAVDIHGVSLPIDGGLSATWMEPPPGR